MLEALKDLDETLSKLRSDVSMLRMSEKNHEDMFIKLLERVRELEHNVHYNPSVEHETQTTPGRYYYPFKEAFELLSRGKRMSRANIDRDIFWRKGETGACATFNYRDVLAKDWYVVE